MNSHPNYPRSQIESQNMDFVMACTIIFFYESFKLKVFRLINGAVIAFVDYAIWVDAEEV